jgi:Zn-finger nucleic acid-binding protein
MPYVTCKRCGLNVYSAARFTSTDCCPRCGVELDRGRSDPEASVRAAESASGIRAHSRGASAASIASRSS